MLPKPKACRVCSTTTSRLAIGVPSRPRRVTVPCPSRWATVGSPTARTLASVGATDEPSDWDGPPTITMAGPQPTTAVVVHRGESLVIG